MIFRQTYFDDFNKIAEIIKDTQNFFKEHNINQWQDDYPTPNIVKKDIEYGSSYVLMSSDEEIYGTAVVTFHYKNDLDHPDDIDLITNYPYASIHRIAIRRDKKRMGYSEKLIKNIELVAIKNNCSCIKVDTHSDNAYMINFLKDFGFEFKKQIQINPDETKDIFLKELD